MNFFITICFFGFFALLYLWVLIPVFIVFFVLLPGLFKISK
jgi:hypothetical protein